MGLSRVLFLLSPNFLKAGASLPALHHHAGASLPGGSVSSLSGVEAGSFWKLKGLLWVLAGQGAKAAPLHPHDGGIWVWFWDWDRPQVGPRSGVGRLLKSTRLSSGLSSCQGTNGNVQEPRII